MGASPSFPHYSVPLEGTSTADATAVFRAATHANELVEGLLRESVNNCWDLFQLGRRKKGDGPFLGRRTKKPDGSNGPYVWRSYNEVDELARYAGSGIRQLTLAPTLQFPEERYEPVMSMRLLGIYSKNREEWVIIEQAANAYNFALVPLFDTLGKDALRHILVESGLHSVVCTKESIANLLDVCKDTNVTNIVFLDPKDELTPKAHAAAKQLGCSIVLWSDLLATGKRHPAEVTPGTLDSLHTLCYTSGTTGRPKGVIQTQRNFVANVCAFIRGPLSRNNLHIQKSDVHLSYIPFAHVFERIICSIATASGAAIAFYGGDNLKLLEDLNDASPTILTSLPPLFKRINEKVLGDVDEKSPMVNYIFNKGMDAKLSNLRSDGTSTSAFWDGLLFKSTKELLGGRVRFMIVGGAPLPQVVRERIAVLFCCPLLEGYGLTEATGNAFLTSPSDSLQGSVGGVLCSIEFKLQSLPQINCRSTDDPPRGELCIRGPGVSMGYFRNPEKAAAHDEEGWLHTGDVCTLLPNRAIKITDRLANMVQLANGEFVSPEKVEMVYQQSPLVAQVYSFGYVSKSSLVGIVVPDVEMSLKWAGRVGRKETTIKELCELAEFSEAVKKSLKVQAQNENLKKSEMIKAFKLEPEPFSLENGLLTPTFKLRRHQALKVFQADIDKLHKSLKQ